MNTIAARIAAPPARRFIAPIVTGGLIAGAIDLTYAFTYHGITSHIAPARILQSIASGLLGMAAFDGGMTAAAVGFVSHFMILIGAAAIYYAASRRFAFLRDRAYLSGMIFGIGIYATMHLIVLPLSAAPQFKSSWPGTITDFAVHVLLLGPAVALTIRRFDRSH